MSIHVKYFGDTGVDSFEKDFESLDELMKEKPFRPFGEKNNLGSDGKGFVFKDTHWLKSKITGSPLTFTGFDEKGKRVLFDKSRLVHDSQVSSLADKWYEENKDQIFNEVYEELKEKLFNYVFGRIKEVLPDKFVVDVDYSPDTLKFTQHWENLDSESGSDVVFVAVEECP